MKNVVQFYLSSTIKAISAFVMLVFLTIPNNAHADIVSVSANADGGFVPGGTSTVIVNVSFSSNTMEFADFIEIRPPGPIAGMSFAHGVPTPSPYTVCGGNKGMEMTSDGPGWGTPMFISGGSGCGAFEPNMTHTFGIEITSDGTYTDNLTLEVRVVGDGNGEVEPSVEVVTVNINPVVCTIMCPDIAPLNVPSGSCSVNFNVPPPVLSGQCGNTPPVQSGTFPVGETLITYEAQDANGNDISCSTLLIVLDDEDPVVLGTSDVTYDLQSGECGLPVPQTFSVNENCIDPERSITQNEDLGNFEAGYHCVGGPTKYLRVFNADDEDVDTELHIEDVTFGVLESYGSPSVTVNVYRVNGTPTYANMELLGSGVEVLPDFEDGLYSIPVSATILPGENFAIEIVVPGSQYNGVIMAMNQGGETAPTYAASDFCNVEEPTTLSSLGFPGYAAVMIVEGYETSWVVVPVGNSPEIGDTIYEGVNNIELLAVDASGNTTNISYQVTINGFEDYITAIACNDEVQISLDEDCIAIVTSDMILEGGPYACYDEYSVEITDEDGNNYGNTLTGDNIGQKLTVKITGPNLNSCWGEIVLQDKAPTPLECMDIYTTCSGSIEPGAKISEMVTFVANVSGSNDDIDTGAPSSNIYTIPVFGLFNATTTGASIRLNVEHTRPSDLSATLAAPDGTTITLFTSPGQGCDTSDIFITLNDDAFNTYEDLQSACTGEVPAIEGSYQPQQWLNAFAGGDPNGDWILTIYDNVNGEGGTVVSAELVISQSGGLVGFPTENDVIYQTEGNNTFTVIGIDACGPATLAYNDDVLEQDCFSPYSQIIQRRWSATDENGNVSEDCTQTIYVYRNGLETLMFPPNYDGIQEPYLSCDDFGDMNPGTDVTGEPFGDLCDNVQVFPYTDTKIDICQGSYKLIRHFRLLEWCSGEVVDHDQIIKVLDDEGPVLEPVADLTVSAGDHDCTADLVVPKPVVISDCSDEFEYSLAYLIAFNQGAPVEDTVYYSDNVSQQGNNFILSDLPFGNVWVRWRVYDECGNYSEDYFTITVEDQISPIAVCDEFTVVSVGSDGYVDVYAETFDDGSIDNCGILDMRARKMTNKCATTNTSFGEKVRFCCEEVGETIMVAFEVTDLYNNKNTCMVEVTVQDKLPPYITECPADITLNCQADYTDLEVTGEPVYIDNCEVINVEFEDSGDIDNCGEGVIFRTWTVTDKQGFKASCVQRITLFDDDPFTEDDIDWPNDYEANTCNTDLSPDNLPEVFAYPRYDDDNCSLVAATYKDKVFTFVDGACVKILREWTIIDWCTFEENDPLTNADDEGYYTHLQIIKLINSEAPEFTSCEDQTVDVFGNCQGVVVQEVFATDDCTPDEEILYTYQIDLYSDGIDGIDFSLKGTGNSFSRTLPIGEHTVSWIAQDQCGNYEYCTYTLTVRDGKQPSPYCLSSITTVVMNNNGMIDIWASDFDYGSYDNCTEDENLLISFSQDVEDDVRIFSCDDLPNGEEEHIQLEIWVTDEAGNQDYCSIELILQDSNADVCPNSQDTTDVMNISGHLMTENNNFIEGVQVTAQNSILDIFQSTTTGQNGTFTFNSLPEGVDYTVNAYDNTEVTNGVSTLDLVLIQRHILGLKDLDSPYKLIASDINNDESIKASDLLVLRKIILGVIDEFPNGQQSWRFIDENTVFGDPTNPFPYTDGLTINNPLSSLYNSDLIGIKIGDVNGNAVVNYTGANIAETRSAQSIEMYADDLAIEDGRIEMPVYTEDFAGLTGYQFTMNTGDAELLEVVPGQLNVDEAGFAMFEGQITSSWYNAIGQDVTNNTPLFTLVFTVNENVDLSTFRMNSSITSAEAYDVSNTVYDLNFGIRNVETTEDFEVYQNRPNPFMDATTISFYIPESSDVELSITDMTGRLVYNKTTAYPAGDNQITVYYDELNTTGVMYYTIKAGQYIATKKMINVR